MSIRKMFTEHRAHTSPHFPSKVPFLTFFHWMGHRSVLRYLKTLMPFFSTIASTSPFAPQYLTILSPLFLQELSPNEDPHHLKLVIIKMLLLLPVCLQSLHPIIYPEHHLRKIAPKLHFHNSCFLLSMLESFSIFFNQYN